MAVSSEKWKGGFALVHTFILGDDTVGKKKSFRLHFIQAGDQRQSDEIIKALAKRQIEKVLAKHGAVAYNLDEVLSKYITGDTCDEQEKGQGIRPGFDDEGLTKG